MVQYVRNLMSASREAPEETSRRRPTANEPTATSHGRNYARDNDFGKLITCRRDALESNPPGSSYGVCMLLGEALVYDQLKRFYLFRIVKTIIFTS